MMAPSKEARDKWVRGLKYAMQMEQLAEQRNETNRWVREAFNMADKNGDGHLDFEEVLKLLKTLNTDIKKKYAKEMFDAADTNKNVGKGRSVLDKEEFVNFYHRLTKRVELEEIFLAMATNLYATEDECRNIVDNFEPEGNCRKKDQLSEIGFRNYLIAERQQIFNPANRVVWQDMNRPLTHYFVASSHNTYLAEDQLKGPSKVEMYITALRKGCRCVELDCWDGSEGEPVIYHGHTLTSKILFKDVIKAVNDYAFEASPYPLTLSLENHCSVEQQKVMAENMVSILGDKLWCPQNDYVATPSPEQLRYRIIIKGKTLPLSTNDDDLDVSDEDEAADLPSDPASQEPKEKSSSSSSDGHKKIKLSPELSSITSMKSVSFKVVDSSFIPDPTFSVVSLGESKVEKLIQTNPFGLNDISHSKMIRTYPAGTRTDSSNYNPVPMWNHGCQVVALNYQTGGEAMQLNHGRFMDNGGVGYVLKPAFLMSEDLFPLVTENVSRSVSKVLKITIISGYQIPKPNDSTKGEIIDPFVKVEIYGVPSDVAEYKTKVMENNGFNPRWRETCSFKIRVPELALVRFTVTDHDRTRDDFIGYYCLPVLSIQDGFRHFPLFDKYGNQFSQTLIFTHVTLTNA
ncbi:1-phosphatidylinositol 4,5-bisphosphate phosphodiesterase eta-1 [Aplysia californica]|uniref:Phosphoinositide phospholipase C n=1 Tax=Aplysia californica TaxID=6500 RepID=A0ABM0JAT9_APLCA|nr:1-phosphatidylinositol 4,5-bisphosphate phosphodiesterase eta-1 [Aplysia californica]